MERDRPTEPLSRIPPVPNAAILDDMWSILAPVDVQDFEIVAGAAGSEHLDAYEATLGFKLPDEFRSLALSELGGVYVTARNERWPRAKLYDVGPAWTFWRGVLVFGLAQDVPDWLSLSVALGKVRELAIKDFAPVLKVEGDPRLYGFRADHTIAVLDGDELEADDAGSFGELYKREIDALLVRMDKMKVLQAERAGR